MKVQNWPNVAAKGISDHMNTEFVWGKKDCCLAIADIVFEYTCYDFAEEFRGKYKTAAGSVRALKKYGKGTIADTIDTKYERIPEGELPSRGDLALVNTEAGESLAIIFSSAAWAMSETGMVDLPLSSVIKSWRVE